MVAQKRGRGGKAAQAKAKAAAPAEEEPQPAAEAAAAAADDSVEPMEENNGAAEAGEGEGEAAAEAAGDTPAAEVKAEGADQSQEEVAADGEAKPEEPKEEKIEPGKLLVENLPTSCLFDYQEKLKEIFSKHGEVAVVKRGPIIVTEQITTPTLSAIVEFKNKDSLEKAITEQGTLVDGRPLALTVEVRADTSVLIGVPYEACTEYVRALMAECGAIAQMTEFSKTKYKILRVTFEERSSVETALKLDRELRMNGFLVTVSQYRDEEDQRQHNANAKNKRQHPQQQNRPQNNTPASNTPPAARNNSFRGRGGGGGGGGFNARGGGGGGGFRGMAGGRGRGGFPARGGAFPRGGYAGGINNYMPPAPYMPRPGGFMNDGQRPNKRLRQM